MYLKSLSIVQMKKKIRLSCTSGLVSSNKHRIYLSSTPATPQPHLIPKSKQNKNNSLSPQWYRSVGLALEKLYHLGRRLGGKRG